MTQGKFLQQRLLGVHESLFPKGIIPNNLLWLSDESLLIYVLLYWAN